MDKTSLLERFLRYIAIDTTADDAKDTSPSSPGQIELGALLAEELKKMGVSDVVQDPHGVVTATIPGTVARRVPVIAFCAHLDTSPETPAAAVRPQVVEDYIGGDIDLPDADPEHVLRVSENPALRGLSGCTIITTDGTTLLGADDKAGIAVLMEATAYLIQHAEVAHGPVRLCFTPDEESGRGTDHVDVKRLGAEVCYTLDGEGQGLVDTETFSGDLALIRVRGVNIHPGIAKGRMINAIRVAAAIVQRLPVDSDSPESTEQRQGFLHPYDIQGGVGVATLRVLIRDFTTDGLKRLGDVIHDAVEQVRPLFPEATIDVAIEKQYRNMADGLRREPRAVEYALDAWRRVEVEPRTNFVRGGTDGSRLTEKGLPTPNLSTGAHNPHSPLEWACLEEMESAAKMVVELTRRWAEE